MFELPALASTIELQGCLYNFETPNSQIKIKFFQSAAGKDLANGMEFLQYLKPVRELLASNQIKDIRQLVQRELDDVRILNSLIPYILNIGGILGENGIAFFPSVLGVLMPKNYLTHLGQVYPTKNFDRHVDDKNFTIDYYESADFNWSVKLYKDVISGKPHAYSSLTIDTKSCDVVIIDGQHRINAFRAACQALSTENDVVKQIYSNCPHYPAETIVNLPVTLLWFEIQDNAPNASISPEIISRKLFIDVNNSAKAIATSRKILLDDRNPVNLITNHFYSLVAEKKGYVINHLSLAHLGFDVPSEIPQQSGFNSIPLTYITTPERLKYAFDAFFVRNKSYSLGSGIQTLEARKRNFTATVRSSDTSQRTQLNVMFPNSSTCITEYLDAYFDTSVLIVSDNLAENGENGETNQGMVRKEFEHQYYSCFYKLLSEFEYFKSYLLKLSEYDAKIRANNGNIYLKKTWESVFLEGKSLFFTLRDLRQPENVFSAALNEIENEFINKHLTENYNVYSAANTISETALFSSFRTVAFQIGYIQAFYEYCKLVCGCEFATVSSEDLNLYCDNFIKKVNEIKYSEWANWFEFLRDLQGETHPKFFPVITHLILRKIQEEGQIFDMSDNHRYMAPECFYFHKIAVLNIKNRIEANIPRNTLDQMELNELLDSEIGGVNCKVLFDEIINEKKIYIERVFQDYLNIPTFYLDQCFDRLKQDIYENILKK
jgi:hypothetical protein